MKRDRINTGIKQTEKWMNHELTSFQLPFLLKVCIRFCTNSEEPKSARHKKKMLSRLPLELKFEIFKACGAMELGLLAATNYALYRATSLARSKSYSVVLSRNVTVRQFAFLPLEAKLRIMHFCSPRDLTNLSLTCRHMRKLIHTSSTIARPQRQIELRKLPG